MTHEARKAVIEVTVIVDDDKCGIDCAFLCDVECNPKPGTPVEADCVLFKYSLECAGLEDLDVRWRRCDKCEKVFR